MGSFSLTLCQKAPIIWNETKRAVQVGNIERNDINDSSKK